MTEESSGVSMMSSLGAGARAAMRQPWLAALLWAWSVALSAAAAVPAWVWLSRGLSLRPRGDELLGGFVWEILKELTHYDASSVVGVLLWAAAGPLAIAALGNAFVSGGVLDVLWSREDRGDDPGPRLQRFFRGAGRYFLVNLRILLLTSAVATILIVLLLSVSGGIAYLAEDTQVELVAWAVELLPLVLAASVVVVWGTVLDFARARAVAIDARSAVGASLWAVFFVARHPVSAIALWKLTAGASLLLAALGIALVPYVPVGGWLGIFAIVVAQQATVFARAAVRIAAVAAEIRYAGARGVSDEL